MRSEDRVAVVTGAAGGIGGALARGLIARGARRVIACDINSGGAETLREDLGEAIVPKSLDVADERATVSLIDEVEDSIGPIDLWFANAGVASATGVDADDDLWNKQWRVNVMSHVYAARHMLPRWLERDGGHLVTTASMAGILSSVGDAAYSATKHAALGLAEWLAYTYGARGIRVSCICPGAVDTAMLRAGAGGDAAKASAAIGGGDVLSPEAAAEVVLDAVAEDRFLILTHPDLQRFAIGKAQEPERWIGGMTRLWTRAQELLASQS